MTMTAISQTTSRRAALFFWFAHGAILSKPRRDWRGSVVRRLPDGRSGPCNKTFST